MVGTNYTVTFQVEWNKLKTIRFDADLGPSQIEKKK